LLKFAGQKLQFEPDHWLEHEQLHPDSRFPETFAALPLQLAAIVHVSEQFGIVPL
jgi:hypothetical protein